MIVRSRIFGLNLPNHRTHRVAWTLFFDAKRPRLDTKSKTPNRKNTVPIEAQASPIGAELKLIPIEGEHKTQAVPVRLNIGKISHKPKPPATAASDRKSRATVKQFGIFSSMY